LQVALILLPVLALLYRTGNLNRVSILLSGFVAGCLPYVIWMANRAWSTPTAVALARYGPDVLLYGTCGVLGALVYVLTVAALMRSNNRWRGP